MPIVFQFSTRDLTVMVRKLTMVTECKTKLLDEEEGAGQTNKLCDNSSLNQHVQQEHAVQH